MHNILYSASYGRTNLFHAEVAASQTVGQRGVFCNGLFYREQAALQSLFGSFLIQQKSIKLDVIVVVVVIVFVGKTSRNGVITFQLLKDCGNVVAVFNTQTKQGAK